MARKLEECVKSLEIKVNQKIVKGFVEKVGAQLWISINGKTIAVETTSQKARRGKSSVTGNSPEITAPMPGKITSIKMKLGDKVEVGDVVLVMEAMKMEYSLKAQIAGTLQSITCTEQQQVTLGQVLAEIEGVK